MCRRRPRRRVVSAAGADADGCCAGALERLDVVAAPSAQGGSPLQAVLGVIRATQAALEASQTSTFGAKVRACTTVPSGTCIQESMNVLPQRPGFACHMLQGLERCPPWQSLG
jgi:hypothetical protein